LGLVADERRSGAVWLIPPAGARASVGVRRSARTVDYDQVREEMAVLMTAQIPGATKEMIDSIRHVLDDIPHAKGFIIHANGPVPGGWRVTEVWESQADFEAWFEASVKPVFPEGGPMPSIAFDELNEVVRP
jgi:hypothetical protein